MENENKSSRENTFVFLIALCGIIVFLYFYCQHESAKKAAEIQKARTEEIQKQKKEWERQRAKKQRKQQLKAKREQKRNAEFKVKSLPCTHGGTVNEYLDKKAFIPAIEDLGWTTSSDQGGLIVERRMVLSKRLELIYRWRVNSDGTVVPKNGKAISITK